MARVFCTMLVMGSVSILGVAGCGPKPPEPTGDTYEVPQDMQDMSKQMFESYQKGDVNRAQ